MKGGLLALSPLLVFVVLYLLTSIVAGDFYRVPITVAFLAASVYAIVLPLLPALLPESRLLYYRLSVCLLWLLWSVCQM